MKRFFCFDGASTIHQFDTLEEARAAAEHYTRKKALGYPTHSPVCYGEVVGHSVEKSRREPNWLERLLYGEGDIVEQVLKEVS